MPQTDIIEPPFYPIIYVRGYAGSEVAVEETVATPYMGFNLGSTKLRQRWDKRVERHIFESPLIRLMKEFQYRDIYVAGEQFPEKGPIPARSVIIYRYYDQVSKELDPSAERPDIPIYAEGLNNLILQVRDKVCGDDVKARAGFRVYLVAHSMGGLICRCFLQNGNIGKAETKRSVDKVFTYATPHNGIEFRVIGNVPGFFSRNNQNNFNRKKMAGYLQLSGSSDRVDRLDGKFPPERFFCLVGTDHNDYEVAKGFSRRIVGPMSDGLVRIDNATVQGAPRAFVYRSHSGHYGIVNSEDGYQNLSRFLFGDVRVDGVLAVHSLSLPPRVQRDYDAGREVRASYYFEALVRPRRAHFDLHRRTFDEGSAVLRKYDEMLHPERENLDSPRNPYLFSVFLSTHARKGRGPLVFSLDLGVLVPEYEVDGVLFFDNHIRGTYLFRDGITVAAVPPTDPGKPWTVRYGYDSRTPGRATRRAKMEERSVAGSSRPSRVFKIPVKSSSRPGLDATLELRASAWNVR